MSWIKMRTNLRTAPKVVRLASALKADRLRIIGGLWAVWSIFDEHSVDGTLEGYTLAALDEDLGWRGFSAALADVSWLEETEAGLILPEFEEHNGASAKRRATEAKRKSTDRKEDKGAHGSWNASGQMSALDADTEADNVRTRVRLEKEKEKDSTSLRSVEPARRGSRLAADWTPGESGDAFATSLGLQPGHVASELAKFRDFWASKPGKDGTKLDWQATWRNWLRSAAERMPRTAANSPAESFRERDERLARERADEFMGRRPQRAQQGEIIDMEASDVAPRRLG